MGISEFICANLPLPKSCRERKVLTRRFTRGFLAAILLVPLPAFAVDGRIEVQGNRQDGGAGATAYQTSTLVENYSLGQRIFLQRNFVLQLDFLTRRQTLKSQSVPGDSRSEIVSLLPNASLTYRSEGFRAGLNGRAIRKDHSGTGVPSWRDDHADVGGWLRRNWTYVQVEGRFQESASKRETAGEERDTREHLLGAGITVNPTVADELRYTYSKQEQELRTFGNELTFRSHNLQYRGGRSFFDGRGRISLDARTSFLRQTSAYNESGGLEYAAPIWGGFSLDDTPEELDPLEPDPVLTAGLFDQDRDTPTVINIGDSAPVVRQYGGDYRNLIFDFGDTEQMDEILLFVDTVLRFPELMQWRVLTSDDPEGRIWSNELGADQFTATWFEQANGRQGWRFTLTSPITHRRIKLVNFKLGLTEPDILINEMEVYRTLPAGTPDLEQTVRRHRLQGDFSFDLTSALEVNYSTNLSGRHFEEEDRDVTGASHRFGANLVQRSWRLSASQEINRVRNDSGQDTDANSQHVALSMRHSRRLASRLAWSRTDDRSWTLRNLTQTASGDLTWQVAPRLSIIQKVTYGTRDAYTLGVESYSWTASTTIRGRPRPSLELELRRSDRWVNQEAGAGFTTFNNTELQSTWALRPLLVLTSQVIYQVRDEDDILVRNSLVWTPLPGGSVSLRLHANDLQDTRSDYFQRGAGGMVVWKPRPRLNLESGIEWVLIKQYDERNTPTNLQFRGSWTF